MVPVFPPFDLPTWTSLATGLYPQNTGVVGDYMYNLQNKEMFNRDNDNASLDGWWTEGEPIWLVIIIYFGWVIRLIIKKLLTYPTLPYPGQWQRSTGGR